MTAIPSGKLRKMTIMNNDIVSVGIIGAGHITSKMHLPILKNTDDTEIKFIADIEYNRAANLSNYFTGTPIEITDRAELPDCDVLLLAIPVGVRREYIEEFAERDIPIFTEKPFASDLEAHKYFLGLSDELSCNYMRTSFSSIRQIDQIIQSKTLGDLRKVTVNEQGKWAATGKGPSHYQNDPELAGGGVLMERGCHLLSQLVFLFRDYNISVQDSSIIWNGNLDSEVQSQLKTTSENQDLEISLMISRIRPVGNQALFEFEKAEVVFDQTDAGSPLKIKNKKMENELRIEPDMGAQNTEVAMYLKWRRFIDEFVKDKEIKQEDIGTAPELTHLISEIYEKGDKR